MQRKEIRRVIIIMPPKMMNRLRIEQGNIPQVIKSMYSNSPTSLIQKDSPHKEKIEHDYQYLIKGVGEDSYKLESEDEI